MVVDIRIVDWWPEDEIVNLYKEGGWWKESYDKKGVGPLMRGSLIFVVAVDRSIESAVGMGRCISDGVSDAYIQDVVVKRDYRSRGIGTRLIEGIVEELGKRGISWIGLIAEKGSSNFYRRMGFMDFEGEPMVMEVH